MKTIARLVTVFFIVIISIPLIFTATVSASTPMLYTVVVKYGFYLENTGTYRDVTKILDISYVETETSGSFISVAYESPKFMIYEGAGKVIRKSGKIAESDIDISKPEDINPNEFDIIPAPATKVIYIKQISLDDRAVKEKENLLV